jgi:hypothetical protein
MSSYLQLLKFAGNQDVNVIAGASTYGYIEIIRYMVDLGIVADLTRFLNVAANEGHAEIVQFLIEKGADPSRNKRPLTSAVREGHLEVVRVLLANRGYLPEQTNGYISVYVAARHGHVEIMKLLLTPQMDSFITFNNLLSITIEAGHLEMLKYLLRFEKVHHLNHHRNQHGLLIDAIHSKRLEIVRYLLSETSLEWGLGELLEEVAKTNDIDVARLILDRIPESSDLSAGLAEAVRNNHPDMIRLFTDRQALSQT